eukprot:TRINITY_DN226_c0_g1_i3.p1 TRINITY_DN226_c0_g1~~TRINITY_DN226_c0_g1_i3.p1  ORF type:complete len:282 (+),score=40.15 TRINITY_DN226_c0_g1_i3:2491-3336(+)
MGLPPLTRSISYLVFRYGKNRDGYWNNDMMVNHVNEVLDMFEVRYPDCQALIIVDWSSGHAKMGSNCLGTGNVSVHWGGKQRLMRDTELLEDYPKMKAGEVQSMVFKEGDPVPICRCAAQKDIPATHIGQAKGMKQVLYERGLYDPIRDRHMKKADLDKLLNNCKDFIEEKSLLQKTVESRGFLLKFLPKCHPELNPIERVWSRAKYYCRINCDYSLKSLQTNIPLALGVENIPQDLCSRYSDRSDEYLHQYASGLPTSEVYTLFAQKKFRSHRRIYDNTL